MTQAVCEVRVEEQPVEQFFHGVRRLLCVPWNRDGEPCHQPRLASLTAQVVQQQHPLGFIKLQLSQAFTTDVIL